MQTPKVYCKILNVGLKHNGYQFKDGLNVDTVPFEPHECIAGGFHFCEEKDIFRYLHLGTLFASVDIPDDAQRKVFQTQLKADKIRLYNVREISTLPCWKDVKKCKEALKLNGYALKYVPAEMKTFDLCWQTFLKHYTALQFFPKEFLTAEICARAVKEEARALQFVPRELINWDMAVEATLHHGPFYVPEELKTRELYKIAHNKWGTCDLVDKYFPAEYSLKLKQ